MAIAQISTTRLTGQTLQNAEVRMKNTPAQTQRATFYIEGTGTTSGGTVLLEECSDESFAGTWSIIQTITASTQLTGGLCLAVHAPAVYGVIRARISSAITGGGTIAMTILAA